MSMAIRWRASILRGRSNSDCQAAKPIRLTFRIEPCLKETLRTAAAHEHRSIANMVEV